MVGFVPPMQELLNNSGMALPNWMAQDLKDSQEIIDKNVSDSIEDEINPTKNK